MTWWLQPGWRETKCACGATIWPEGDPDWGACFTCFNRQLDDRKRAKAEKDKYYAGMAKHLEAQEWASYCAPWFETGKREASHDEN